MRLYSRPAASARASAPAASLPASCASSRLMTRRKCGVAWIGEDEGPDRIVALRIVAAGSQGRNSWPMRRIGRTIQSRPSNDARNRKYPLDVEDVAGRFVPASRAVLDSARLSPHGVTIVTDETRPLNSMIDRP